MNTSHRFFQTKFGLTRSIDDPRTRRLDEQFHRLHDGLAAMGFEALRLGAESPEHGIVDSTLSIVRQLAAILDLQGGWGVPAAKLLPGMVVENSGYPDGQPEVLHVVKVSEPDEDGMVLIYAQDGFVSRPVNGNWPYELRTVERAALEEQLVDAEQDRLGIARQDRDR